MEDTPSPMQSEKDAGQPGWLHESLTDDFIYAIRSEKLLYSGQSAFQKIEVHESKSFGRMLLLDDVFNVSELDEYFYHENLAHIAACSHPLPKSALIVGGANGGVAEELLKHECIEKITMVECDSEVVRVARTYLQSIHRGALDDDNPRIALHITDAFPFIKQSEELFDLIVLDLPGPGGLSTPLHTAEFYRLCAGRLHPGGIVSLNIASPLADPERCIATLRHLENAFSIVRPFLVTVPLSGGLWMMACASQEKDPADTHRAELQIRLRQRHIGELQYYNCDTHHAVMALPNFILAQIKSALRSSIAPSGDGLIAPAG